MRKIEFRLWDKERKEWLDHYHHYNANCYFTVQEPHRINFFRDDRYIVQQFTGLYDSSGKEMFEGDIVEINTNSLKRSRNLITWENRYACFSLSAFVESNINSEIIEIRCSLSEIFLKHQKVEIKIIGNCIDNKNLLDNYARI